MSTQVQSLRSSIFLSLEANQEFMSLSIDATLKVCMTVQGQANYRASAAVRNSACFDDEASLRRVLTVRGRTGAVIGMVPVPGEDAPNVCKALSDELSYTALSQVRFIATDCPSSKLFRELKGICPNLCCLSLDPVHLAIVYEYAHWKKRTPGSKVLRRLLNKVNNIDPAATMSSWGAFFCGEGPEGLCREEDRARSAILTGSMSAPKARRIIEELDADKPLFCRVTFVETLAAICKLYPDEVNRKVTGSNKEVRKVLWAASAPDRMEWLFNNLRARHAMSGPERALMPSGTASNEALHAEINSWGKSIRNLHKSTLRLKLIIMHFGKLLAHHVASCHPGIRQTSESVLLARSLAKQVWTEEEWEHWCHEQSGGAKQGRRAKAPVPLHRARQTESQQVQEWQAMKGKLRVRKPHMKRTVHTVPRVHSIRSAGVKQK